MKGLVKINLLICHNNFVFDINDLYEVINFRLFLFSFLPRFYSQEVVKAQLIDYTKNKIPAYCGYSEQYGLLKLLMLEDSEELKSGDTIFIFHPCPRELMQKYVGEYTNNSIYKLNLGEKVDKSEFQSIKSLSYTRYMNKTNNNLYQGWLENNFNLKQK
ncbi:hypothetical protein NZ698_02150 [Chryseobacterium sp. PBS4-4]|uniref:Uncharacterized protein n=1 Tax=Chryseobacterium edaphi TaxID=2976532 RepID=A0ABT2W180_9FLAO|nr:hypothetical protein [Chryseobacterium edaphi]MCU7615986.1 hypothetical protein [Chryseobacterium edaphi]